MNSTALGAENIIFISDVHEKFYYEKLKEVRYQDVYHKALCYCLGINDDTRRNANRIYDFKTGYFVVLLSYHTIKKSANPHKMGIYLSNDFIVGKSRTSRIAGELVSSITRRSIP